MEVNLEFSIAGPTKLQLRFEDDLELRAAKVICLFHNLELYKYLGTDLSVSVFWEIGLNEDVNTLKENLRRSYNESAQ